MLLRRFTSLFLAVSGFAAVIISANSLIADVTPIGPFVGDFSDNMNYTHPTSPSGTGSVSELEIFGGFATMFDGPVNSSIKIENNSTRAGDTVNPRSAPRIVGSFGVIDWEFEAGISQFGGYFENNSRFDDITIEFFDIDDQLIATVTALAPIDAQQWTWNGWHSDTPIFRVTTQGNDVGFDRGFIWYEDMEVTLASVPEPGSLLISAIPLCWLLIRTRNQTRRGRPEKH